MTGGDSAPRIEQLAEGVNALIRLEGEACVATEVLRA